ncbi:MAG: type II secretion system F family protein [Acidimicrobiales bacterium]
MTIIIVFLCAVGFGLGIVGIIGSCVVGHPGMQAAPRDRSVRSKLRVANPVSIAGACIAGAAVAVATGWPVAFIITAVGAYGLPKLFGQTSGSVAVAKIEAIATWTEMLQGTLAASAGLSQAIMTTAPLTPPAIREPAMALSARIAAGMHPREALLRFGDELADPCADRVICSLLLAVSSRAQRLGDLLAALADSTRDEVALRLRIETSRASIRSGVRTVLVFSVGFAAALTVLARAYLAPFATGPGQVVLLAVGALYAGGLTLMVTLARPPVPVRLLGPQVVQR